jgi:hypothetical protein
MPSCNQNENLMSRAFSDGSGGMTDYQSLAQAAAALQKFGGADLTATLSKIEAAVMGLTSKDCASMLATAGADGEALAAAAALKRAAGQINVAIHAIGILLCLPHILEPCEQVEYVSLGAGNTGRAFDLETNHRIAEFKFIRWRGGSESIRQDQLFKDFFLLAESGNAKRKHLYVIDTTNPLKFLNGGRALASVLGRNVAMLKQFEAKYSDRFKIVRDYYLPHKHMVAIEDVSSWVPELIADAAGLED